MTTIAYDSEGPGKARVAPLESQSSRRQKIVTGSLSFDSSYPTGGEDIAEIFNQFASLQGIWIEQPLAGAQTGKFAKVDYTNKKAQLYTNASPAVEVANASDQSAIAALRFLAWGI